MLRTIATKIFGSRNDRILRRLNKIVKKINGLEPSFEALSDDELKAKTDEFRQRLANGETLEQLMPEAFATVREASRRVLGMRHFDVQLVGGMVLTNRNIAEMRTGEGKTLTATLPCYLNALTGKGVHVVTVNDYLARRDAETNRPLFEFLGMTVAVNVPGLDPEVKRDAYKADITYATNSELGFDYLRDNLAHSAQERFQRPLHYALVDEVDSILIDEARTPLIISGPAADSSELYIAINKLIPSLVEQEKEDSDEFQGTGDYSLDLKNKQANLTERGLEKCENWLVEQGLMRPEDSLYSAANLGLFHHISAALRAHTLFQRDVDYVVKDGEIVIVDEHTGRTMAGRRWSDGLHQAIEAKEGVKIQGENQTVASITYQNFFRLYEKLAGMTGTADTEAFEFQQIYGLETVVIPTNRPMIRDDKTDIMFENEQYKFDAIIEDIKDCIARHQPVLVGTASIEKSELLSAALDKAGIEHNVLNAKFHAQEAEIVANAGYPGAVTIATNMAGRGTDIVLGGNWKAEVAKLENPTEEQIEAIKAAWQQRHDEVMQAGGLHIIGTERHESRRIDNQLRGRAARQGDPGSSRFFLSLQDEIVRLFGGQQVENILTRVNLLDESVPMEHGMFSRLIEQSQERVEGAHFDARKHTLEYDDVLNGQRKRIYSQRDQVFQKADLSEDIYDMLENDLDARIEKGADEEKWQLAAYLDSVQPSFEIEGRFIPAFTQQIMIDELGENGKLFPTDPETLLERLIRFGREAFEAENNAALDQAETLIENARAGFENQLSERSANFDLFKEALEDRLKDRDERTRDGETLAPLRGQDLVAEASGFARVNFRLSPEDQRRLTEGDGETIEKMRDQIESTLFSVFMTRIHQAFRNRLGDDYTVPTETFAGWEDFSDATIGAVSEGFLARADRLFGDQAQIRSDLNAALKALPAEAYRDGLNEKQWVTLFNAIGKGKRLVFDARTHRKASLPYTRLNFVYRCGELIAAKSDGEIRDQVWNHYLTTLERLRAVFGELDWKRLQNHAVKFNQLRAETQAEIESIVGADVYAELADRLPAEADPDSAAKIKDYLGGRIQNEICRSVILRAITDQWVDYLTEIETLRVQISMEAYAQRNPLVVYKTKAAELFSELLKNIRRAAVERIFVSAPTLGMLTAGERVSLAELRKDQEQAQPAPQSEPAVETEDEPRAGTDTGASETPADGNGSGAKPVSASAKKKKKKMKK